MVGHARLYPTGACKVGGFRDGFRPGSKWARLGQYYSS